MIIDIEHYLKIKILNICETIEKENGYNIVNMYLTNDYADKKRVHYSIFKKMGNDYYQKNNWLWLSKQQSHNKIIWHKYTICVIMFMQGKNV